MDERRKDCKKCGAKNVLFGRNKNTYDGLSYWCKMCMAKTRVAGYERTDWKEINRKRRADSQYRQKEREAANKRDKDRRKTDRNYVLARSAPNKKWKNTGDVQGKKDRANARKRARYKEKRAAMSPELLAQLKENQRKGWQEYWHRFNKWIFEN